MLMIIAAVVCVVALPLARSLYDSRQRRRLSARQRIERRATAIAELREGDPVKIRGVVSAREPLLTSAIGERECIGYRSMIDDASYHPDFNWTSLVTREVWPSFLVTDETGAVAVHGPFEIALNASDGGETLPARAYDLLAQDDVRMKDPKGPRRFWFRETLLKPGDRVSVIGRPSRGIGPAGPCVMRGTWDHPIVVAADDEPVRALPAGMRSARPVQIEAPAVHGPSRREIELQATTPIVVLREGEGAKIQGVVAAREPLLASPISGRACVGYRVVIERLAHGSPPVVRREAWTSFLVIDDTGTAAAEGPFSIFLDPDDGAWAMLPPQVYALLEEAGVPVSDMFSRNEEFRFKETLLEPGDRVSVVGRPSLEIDQAGQGTLRAPPRLFVMRGSDEQPVAVTEDRETIG